MRWKSACLVLLVAAAASAAPLPPIAALEGFEAGQWQVKPVGTQGAGSSQCVSDPNLLLTGGKAASECTFNLITSQPDTATVTYRCGSGRSGRTQLRRDTNGLYTVDAQGLEANLPFAARTEWRRTGGC
jgi:hypothetical protein